MLTTLNCSSEAHKLLSETDRSRQRQMTCAKMAADTVKVSARSPFWTQHQKNLMSATTKFQYQSDAYVDDYDVCLCVCSLPWQPVSL